MRRLDLRLKQGERGETLVSLTGGVLPRDLSRAAVAELCASAVRLLGIPVSVVLCVDARSADWCDQWALQLSEVHAGDLEVRFELEEERSP